MRECINKRLEKIDKLKSKIEKPPKKKRRKRKKDRYKRAINRHHEKLKHIQEELHNKTAQYLCENYERIMVPIFETRNMVKKGKNMDKCTKRILGKLSHYKFRQCLLNKTQKYDCQLIIVDESYTSKTCSKCGNVNKKVGREVYECEKCKKKIDRDINGAINIMIKNRETIIK